MFCVRGDLVVVALDLPNGRRSSEWVGTSSSSSTAPSQNGPAEPISTNWLRERPPQHLGTVLCTAGGRPGRFRCEQLVEKGRSEVVSGRFYSPFQSWSGFATRGTRRSGGSVRPAVFRPLSCCCPRRRRSRSARPAGGCFDDRPASRPPSGTAPGQPTGREYLQDRTGGGFRVRAALPGRPF